MAQPSASLLVDFAEEVTEHVEAAEQVLLRAETQSADAADINLLFRSFHSVKGLARVVGFEAAERLAHAAESLLSEVRDGSRLLDPALQDLLLQTLDALKLARGNLLNGIEFQPDRALLDRLELARGDGEASEAPDDREADHPLADLFFDLGTLEGLLELVEEVLPGIVVAVAGASVGPLDDAVRDDLETLAFAFQRIDCLGPQPLLESLAHTPSLSDLARLLDLLSQFAQLVGRPEAMAPALHRARQSLLSLLADALERADGATVALLGRLLVPASPFPGLLSQALAADSPAGLDAAVLSAFGRAMRADGAAEGAPVSDVATLEAADLREQLERAASLPDDLLKALAGRRIDLERFRALSANARARVQRLAAAAGDLFELRLDAAVLEANLPVAAWTVEADWPPLLAETATVDGTACLCLLLHTPLSEGDLRSRLDAALDLLPVVGVTKLDGQQVRAHFSPVERGESATASGAVQVRVPVALLDSMFGRVGQFFGVMTRFNALVFDSEAPAALRELSDFAVLHAPHLVGKVELLIRQQRDLATIEAEAHRLLSQVHETTLGLRVIPLDTLFSRFPRMVRDTARQVGKQVRFDARANGIRVDNGMLELLSDPLMHMLRNSIDHGVEKAEDRVAAGKPGQASVTVTAQQRGNHIVVEVRDDGRGIDIERVRAKALANNLVRPEQAGALADDQVARLIFAPGFSTAASVTDTSGRGVGMDVALVNVTKLGGKIDILNWPGRGCCFRIEIPLSKAIQSMLLADTGMQKVAFPDRTVAEVAICPPGAVQAVNGQRSILLPDRFLPIFRLVDLLHLPVAETRPARDISVVVCEHDGQRIGVEVAAILRRADLLIQEMHPRIAHLPGIGGISTIGADKIVIAVDPDGLFALARQAAVFGLRAHEERVREGLF